MKFWTGPCIKSSKLFYCAESVLEVRYGIQGAVELALCWLYQSLLEPIGSLFFHCFLVGLWHLALLHVDGVVLLQGSLVKDFGGDLTVESGLTYDLG